MQPTQGYNKARSLLEQRFGNEYVIAEVWISKITQGPPIKKFSGEALQDFADEVRSCAETLCAMGRIGEVDSRVRLVKLTERLPFQLQGQWRKLAVLQNVKSGRYPGIDQFFNFSKVCPVS